MKFLFNPNEAVGVNTLGGGIVALGVANGKIADANAFVLYADLLEPALPFVLIVMEKVKLMSMIGVLQISFNTVLIILIYGVF